MTDIKNQGTGTTTKKQRILLLQYSPYMYYTWLDLQSSFLSLFDAATMIVHGIDEHEPLFANNKHITGNLLTS